MNKTDTRKLSQETQYELRKSVVRLREKGLANKLVAEVVGISISHASKIWQAYLKGGEASIQKKIRGRKDGEKRRLEKEQDQEIWQIVIHSIPKQSNLQYLFWTREAVNKLIENRYGFKLSLRTLTEYFSRWGFIAQKPSKYAFEKCPMAVQQWTRETFPEIMMMAKKSNAEVFWLDDTVLHYADENITMLAAISNRRKMRFLFFKDGITAKQFIRFEKRLRRDVGRNVFLIVDERVLHCRLAQEWLDKHRQEIDVFYLPAGAMGVTSRARH
ncbi:MAG: transposase [Firmicutes bacterium]|nr:transposase [Bacillota bacterium]